MVHLNGSTLNLMEMKRVIYEGEKITIDPLSMEKVMKSRLAVEKIVTSGETVYGINRGSVNSATFGFRIKMSILFNFTLYVLMLAG
jgi:histidine ammonia-lyase